MTAIGSFIVGMVLAVAFNRAEKPHAPRTPIWLIIDEMQNFVSDEIKTILAEARKYALHLVLACQVVGQDMSPQLNSIVLGNTAVKIVGNAGAASQSAMSKEMGVPVEEFTDLDIGEFVINFGASPALKVKMRSDYIGQQSMMTNEEWRELRAEMIARYYAEQRSGAGSRGSGAETDLLPDDSDSSQLREEIAAGKSFGASVKQKRKPKYGSDNPFADLELDV